jgi:hypothetical protein
MTVIKMKIEDDKVCKQYDLYEYGVAYLVNTGNYRFIFESHPGDIYDDKKIKEFEDAGCTVELLTILGA